MRTNVFLWAGYNFFSIIVMIIPFFFLYQFRKVWISEETGKGNKVIGERIGMGFVSVITIFLILFTMQIALLKILDFPYSISGKLPHFYGMVIDNRGAEGIQNQETKEILCDAERIGYGIFNLEDNEVKKGEYVEVAYFPYSRGIFVIDEGEEIKQYEINERKDYGVDTVKKEIQGFGILWGFILLISSSIWSYKTIQMRKKRFHCKIQSAEIWRYEWVDKISLVLGTVPLVMAALTTLGAWIFLWDNVVYIQRIVDVLIAIWMFGVLLEVFPYHTILTIQNETFQIGMVDFLKKVYKKSDIKEICYVNNRKMVVYLKSGKKINSWVSNELYNDIRERLIDGSEKTDNAVLQSNQKIVYEGEEAKEFYQKYMKFWKKKVRVLDIFWLIILELIILTVICFRQDTPIVVHVFYIVVVNGIFLLKSLKDKDRRKPKLKDKYVCQLIYIEEFQERKNQVTYLIYVNEEERTITQKGIEIFGDIEKYNYATLVRPWGEEKEFIYFDCSWGNLEA